MITGVLFLIMVLIIANVENSFYFLNILVETFILFQDFKLIEQIWGELENKLDKSTFKGKPFSLSCRRRGIS